MPAHGAPCAAAKAVQRYPEVAYDADTYYTLLKFEFTHELKKALEFYWKAPRRPDAPVSALSFFA